MDMHTTQINSQKHGDITWLDVQNPDTDCFDQLEKDYQLHPVHLNESIQKVQHTQVEREDNYLFLVLHFPCYDSRLDKISIGQVGVFLGRDFLVTIRSSNSPFITDMFANCQHSSEMAESYFDHGPAYVLHKLVSKLLDIISEMIDAVEVELDNIEDLVFESNGSEAQRIGRVRQKIVRLRRVIGPKKLALHDLAQQIDSFTGQSMSKYYSNNTKTVNKLWEVIEEAKETVEIFKDADFTTSTEQTNKILTVLTMVFTFTIPITVLGTLYGMNVPLPGGLAVGAWTFWGPYTSAIAILALGTLMAVVMFLYFRKKKWF
jgi:magnesium transporter